ncbi:hypothetical protein Tco_0800556 [Tanacetum coccineum]|uniref:Uncharacterized protein n=1 Tax=Tanacetum coccineum TaxID=301880 RepID=A0ABQ4ZXP8_9ASTR
MKKLPSIPLRLEEDYHSIKDDISLVSVYTTGNATVRGMLIPDEFLTDDIRATEEYKEYAKEYVRNKKRKQVAGETSSPRKSIKVTIKQKKPGTTSIPPPSDDKEREDIDEATLISLALHKTAITVEAQDNVAKVQEKIFEEDSSKLVDGEDEESYASKFAYSMFQDYDDDSENKIDPRSHKEHPETVDDGDDENENKKKDDKKDDEKRDDDEKKDDTKDKDNGDHIDHTLVGTQEAGSLEIKKEKMQTPIPSPSKSLRKNLSSKKTHSKELTDFITPSTATSSKAQRKKRHISSKYEHIPGTIFRMCWQQGYMIQGMEKKYVTNSELWKVHGKADKVLHEVIPQIASRAIDDLIKNNLKRVVADTIIQERDAFQAEIKQLIPALWDVLKRKFEKSSTSTTSCRDDAFRPHYHDDHQEDDAPPEREKRSKRQKTSKSLKCSKSARGSSSKQPASSYMSERQQQQQDWDAWIEPQVIDEDEVIPEDTTSELIDVIVVDGWMGRNADIKDGVSVK